MCIRTGCNIGGVRIRDEKLILILTEVRNKQRILNRRVIQSN